MNPPVRWLDDPTLAGDLRADLESVHQHPWQPDLARAAESLDAALAAESSLELPSDAAKLAAPSGAAHGSLTLKLLLAALGGSAMLAAAIWQPQLATRALPPPAALDRRDPSTPRALEPAALIPPASADASSSRREIEQLQQIQATLARDPAQAYRLARASLNELPRGPLREEREGLAVIALWQSGDHTPAHALAQRFLSRYPESPLRQRIQALLVSEPVR
jgi:hypothetical protein